MKPAPARSIALAGLVTLIATAPTLATAAVDSDASSADFHYVDGGAAEGQIDATVDLLHARFRNSAPAPLLLEELRGRLEVVETRYNITGVRGVTGFQEEIRASQDTQWHDIESSLVEIGTASSSLVKWFGPGFPADNPRPVPASLRATALDWSMTKVRNDGDVFWYHLNDKPYRFDDDFAVPHRTLTMNGTHPVKVDGSWVLHLRDVTIRTTSELIQTGPHHRYGESFEDPTGSVVRTEIIFTEAFLHVGQGRVALDPGRMEFAVSDMELAVVGQAVFHGAEGSVRVGSDETAFGRQTLGLRGDLRLDESLAPAGDSGPQRPKVDAHAGGAFTVVAVDYVVQAARPAGPTFVEQAVWVTLALGLLGLLVWALQHAWVFLYTRIREDAVLEHPKRAEIMNFVEANPGCHVLRVAEDLGFARSVTRHHLMVLERAGRLRRFHDSGQTLLVPAYQSKRDALRAMAAEDPHLVTIRGIVTSGGVRRAELVAVLRARHGVADPTARRWIEKAVRLGAIEEAKHGHTVTYRGGL